MDEFELLMSETFKHFSQNFVEHHEVLDPPHVSDDELPAGPGILYHIQRSTSVFVIRTLVCDDIREAYGRVMDRPEDYPSLRLIEQGSEGFLEKLRFFVVDDRSEAEIIHDQLSNRRFPVNEEMLCNLSDPGFSWWLTKKGPGFQLSFTLSVIGAETVKLGPLGDHQLAMRNFQSLESIFSEAGLCLNLQNEMNRVQFAEGEEFLMEELKDLFEFGVVSDGLVQLFKLLSRQVKQFAKLETTWFYLKELAAMRRFWIQIEYDLGN